MDNIFNNDEEKKLLNILKNLNTVNELEFMFGNFSKDTVIDSYKFLLFIKFLKYYSDINKSEIFKTEELDIQYKIDDFKIYRVTINNLEDISNFMALYNSKDNSEIFSILCSKIKNNTKNVSIIEKEKLNEDTFNLTRFNVRLRLSNEIKLKDEKKFNDLLDINNIKSSNIFYRYKSRISYKLFEDEFIEIKIDATIVKQSNNINKVKDSLDIYEIELEIINKKKLSTKNISKYYNKINNTIKLILSVLGETNNLIDLFQKKEVISNYYKLLNDNSNNLYTMNVNTLEIIHLVDNLPNNYCVTDKADGQSCLAIIMNNKLYFIFHNFDVKFSGIEISKKLSEYNNTILDGEYIFNKKLNKHIFAAFDILYYKNENVRNISEFENRYIKLKDVINVCFGFKYNNKKYDTKYDYSKLINYYENDIDKYIDYLDNYLNNKTNENIIFYKYIIFPLGVSNSEIFSYAHILWNKYTKEKLSMVPYMLDGLIFTPLKQIYTRNFKELKNKIYKWKPYYHNSIDFYIKFEKDPNTNEILKIFDNTLNENISYNIINLHVGKSINNIEMPVLFKEDEKLYICKITDNDGIIRDIEGEVICDNTVVEFYYDNNLSTTNEFKWIPIRTRHDKTYSVNKYNKKYGNYYDVAESNWNSIINNIPIETFLLLGNESKFNNEIELLKKKIDATTIAKEKQKDVYYQKITDEAAPLRNFNNYVKSTMIFTYCSPKKLINGNIKKLNILDLGSGRGGDLMKFYHSKGINKYIGIDIDANGITSSSDGAISRYNNFRKKFPDFPKMNFIIGDVGLELNYESQKNSNNYSSNTNDNLIINNFGLNNKDTKKEMFDIFNCQLMIHFLFKDEFTWNNFCKNINNYLNYDGYVLITCLDGNIIHEKFIKNSGKISHFYEINGNKKKLFEFISKYEEKIFNKENVGLKYDAFVSMIKDDNNYDTEYLVKDKFIIESLNKKCDLKLIEQENFHNIFLNKKDFFENHLEYEVNNFTKNYLQNVKQFYEKNSMNDASLEFLKLHKLYVFKKIKKINLIDKYK